MLASAQTEQEAEHARVLALSSKIKEMEVLSVCGLKLLVYEEFNLLVYAALSC